MSNLSDLLPAGASAKEATFTASGAISSGDTLVLNTDGTASTIVQTSVSAAVGAKAAAASITGEDTAVVFDSATDKFAFFYADRFNSDYGTYVVGTISGTSITFGTPAVFNSAASTNIDAVYDEASGNIVVVWAQAGTGGRSIVGSRSGNTITFGSAVTFDSNSTFSMGAAYIEDAEKVFISYQRNTAGTGHGIVGTVSGTSISFGSAATMPGSVNPRRPLTAYVGSSKAVVATRDNNVSPTAGKAVVATISGTSVSFGSFVTFETQSYVGTGFQTDVAYDSANDKVVIAWTDGGNSGYGTAIVGTVSGTSISFGTAVVFASTNTAYYYSPTIRYSVKSGKIFTVYVDASNSDQGKYIRGTVSGTSISFADGATFNSSLTRWLSLAVEDTNNKFAVGYIDSNNDPAAQIIQDAYLPTNLTSTNFLGIAKESISDAASGEVVLVGGISENATSEVTTTNSTVYVQDDGRLSTTVSSVEAGLAFGSTTEAGFYIAYGAYDSKSFSVDTQVESPHGVAFKSDGTAMYVLNLSANGTVPNGVAQYTLSTAWDVSTAAYANKSMSSSAQDTSMRGMTFKPDGTKMYLVGSTNPDTMYEYDLSTAWDISTASYNQSGDIDTQLSTPCGLSFKSDGTACFVADQADDDIHQYSLSTPWDISTLSYDSKVLGTTSQESTVQDMAMSSDGTKVYVVGTATDTVYQYNLTTAYDLSTGFYSGISFSIGSQETVPAGMAFSADGKKMYISGNGSGTGEVYQYSTATNLTSKLLLNG